MWFFLGRHCCFYVLIGSSCYLLLRFLSHASFFGVYLSLLISIETCVPLSFCVGTYFPAAPLYPRVFFNRLLLLFPLTSFFVYNRLFDFILWHCRGRRCPLPPAPLTRFYFLTGFFCYLLSFFFSGSFYLYWYLSRLVPMCFFLGTYCASPLHRPTRCYVTTGASCYRLLFFFAYISFIWVHLIALRGEAPVPLHPAFIF